MIKTKSADDPRQCNIINLMLEHLLPPATKLGQGYVFTRVCDSVHIGGLPQCMLAYPPSPSKDPPWQGTHPWQGTPPGKAYPPARCMLEDKARSHGAIFCECDCVFLIACNGLCGCQ